MVQKGSLSTPLPRPPEHINRAEKVRGLLSRLHEQLRPSSQSIFTIPGSASLPPARRLRTWRTHLGTSLLLHRFGRPSAEIPCVRATAPWGASRYRRLSCPCLLHWQWQPRGDDRRRGLFVRLGSRSVPGCEIYARVHIRSIGNRME